MIIIYQLNQIFRKVTCSNTMTIIYIKVLTYETLENDF